MMCIRKIFPVIFTIVIYSCHSNSEKFKVASAKSYSTTDGSKLVQKAPSSIKNRENDIDWPNQSRITFSNFSINVKALEFPGDLVNDHFEPNDTSEKINTQNRKMWTLITKVDSVQLVINETSDISEARLQIIPKSERDQFKISYSFNVRIFEEKGNGDFLNEMAPYNHIKDSANYFFKLPSDPQREAIKYAKRKLKLKDTTFKKQDPDLDYGIYDEQGFVYKNKLCELGDGTILYLKIERFSADILKETKFLVIDYGHPE